MTRFSRPASGRPIFAGEDRGGGRWETAAGRRPGLFEFGADKPPPDPQRHELLAAGQERAAYFEYLNARRRGEKPPKPPLPKFRQYWRDS